MIYLPVPATGQVRVLAGGPQLTVAELGEEMASAGFLVLMVFQLQQVQVHLAVLLWRVGGQAEERGEVDPLGQVLHHRDWLPHLGVQGEPRGTASAGNNSMF